MRTERVIPSIAGVIVVSALLSGCASSERSGSRISQDLSQPSTTDSQGYSPAAARTTSQQDSSPKIDMQAFWQSCLKKYGVDDFSTEHLIELLGSEFSTVRMCSAELLGERKETSAIPDLERTLNDRSPAVRTGVTTALLKMSNRKGISVLQEFVERVSQEVEEGNGEKAVEQLDALEVLADAGEVSAIPHLRKLLKYDRSWGVRMGALRSLMKLHGRDASVLRHVASMQNDEHPQIRKEASRFIERAGTKK